LKNNSSSVISTIPGFRIGIEHISEPYKTLVSELLKALIENWGNRLVSLVVYGSVARGEARSDSDIDLLIVGRGLPKSRFKRFELFEEAEQYVEHLLENLWSKGVYTDFSPIILDVEEAAKNRPIYLDMVIDAVIIYDEGKFMQKVLERLAEKLKQLGAERKYIGKLWYWVLKKEYKFGEVIEI
jgi:predicted nucleotidyltransferase